VHIGDRVERIRARVHLCALTYRASRDNWSRTIGTNIIFPGREGSRQRGGEAGLCLYDNMLHTRLAPRNGGWDPRALGERARRFDLLLYDVISTP